MSLFSRYLAVRIILGTGLLAVLTACSTLGKVPYVNKLVGDNGLFRDHQADYLKAQTIPRAKIPAGLNSTVIDDLLVIPDLPADVKQQPFLEPPQPLPIDIKTKGEVVIQRIGMKSWIVVDASPAQVWPRIRDYWRKNNVVIASENPTSGVMETGWFVLAGNAVTQEKFRVTVETGFQDNSCEIHLLQIEAPQATPVIAAKPFLPQSMNPDTEYTVLTSLSGFLADGADLLQSSSVSFLAANISSSGKAVVATTKGGNDVLQLKADYDRSWAALGRAIKKAGIEVQAQDVEQGYYDLVFVPGKEDAEARKEADDTFFHRLWTLYGLLDRQASLPVYSLRLSLLKTDHTVDVLVMPKGPVKDPKIQDAGNHLLELLRKNLA